ncbi:hypothetical protein LR48_Vigan521s000400 [Vigna angularis]|uniref:Uncharacterized protein n=1 Tax=Phaseolus angularis TaxID=3914 RepID=A0A0L9TD38_PHAAN|nr:hypothetical protein LR48_Vigan521s000400 [Vigna angularis]
MAGNRISKKAAATERKRCFERCSSPHLGRSSKLTSLVLQHPAGRCHIHGLQRPELRGRSFIQRLHSSREDVVMCKGTKKEAWLEVRGRSIIPAAIYEQCPGCAGRNGFTGTELEAGGSHSHGSRSSRVFSVLAAAWNVGTTLPKNLAAEKHTTQTNEGPLLGNIG